MDSGRLSEAITREIVDLHAVFEAWFRGTGPVHLDRVELVLVSTPP